MSLKETVIKFMCIMALICCFVQSASADWYDDLKPNGTWAEIKGNNFVAETFYGVPAYYNENNRDYQCGELIIRFYKEAYGLDIKPYNEPVPVSLTEGYKFVRTTSPKAGDIIYVSKEMRGSSSDHWALVREYNDGYITMFEQNARYNGQAAIGRQIRYPSDSYYVFTPVSIGDAPAPVLKNASTGETDKQPETEKQTTEIPTTEKTTSVPTTAEPTTQKPTTVPSTKVTTAKVTTAKAETTLQPSTQAATQTTAVSETESVTEVYTTEASALTQSSEAYTQQTVQSTASGNESEDTRTALVASGVGVAAIIFAAAGIITLRKKNS